MAPTDPRILALQKAAWDFADSWHEEEPWLTTARGRAADVGCQTVSPGAASLLRVLAALTHASAAVEVGTGAGISAVRLLEGMAPDGVVTSVDAEAEHQVIAREAVAAAGFGPGRVRLINGKPDDVLDRLTAQAYDLVLIATRASQAAAHVAAGHRLLRPGGVLVVNRAMAGDKITDPAVRDPETIAMRTLVSAFREDERFTSALLPIGGGLLVASTRRE